MLQVQPGQWYLIPPSTWREKPWRTGLDASCNVTDAEDVWRALPLGNVSIVLWIDLDADVRLTHGGGELRGSQQILTIGVYQHAWPTAKAPAPSPAIQRQLDSRLLHLVVRGGDLT